MKKIVACLIAPIILQSCMLGVVPLKGSYPQVSATAKVDAPFEQTWQRAVRLIAEKGYSVKSMDKANGLIMVEMPSFADRMSQEDKAGKLISPDADIVVERTKADFPGKDIKYDAKAQWNLLVKRDPDSTSTVSVTLYSINVLRTVTPLIGKSTGNFEKGVLAGMR